MSAGGLDRGRGRHGSRRQSGGEDRPHRRRNGNPGTREGEGRGTDRKGQRADRRETGRAREKAKELLLAAREKAKEERLAEKEEFNRLLAEAKEQGRLAEAE
jgi:hypothetical protein